MNRPALNLPTLYEQLMDLPENITGEIIDGELYTQPRPSGRHGMASSAAGATLLPPFQRGKDGPGGWWILDEPEIHFVRDTVVVVPDLAGWRRERMPAIPEDHRFEVAPDWVCEILSPSTGKKDRTKKLPLYARYGVAYAWLVDPIEKTLEAFKLMEGRWVLLVTLVDEEPVSVEPFDAITFPLTELWA